MQPQISNLSKIESLAFASESEWAAFRRELTDDKAGEILYNWRWNARPSQLMPGSPGAAIQRTDWRFWMVLAGRGFGKTRIGAEACREWGEDPQERILIVGPTHKDVEETMIEGPSGLLSCYPPSRRPRWIGGEVQFQSGALG